MNIKTRLSFQFTLIVAGILLFFSLLVYYFSFSSQLSKFRQNLLSRAESAATLLIDVDEVDSLLLQKIQRSSTSWEKEEMLVTDSVFGIKYKYNTEYLTENWLYAHFSGGDLSYFSVSGKDGVFYRHYYNNHRYYVFAAAIDRSRLENLANLRRVLLWSILFSIWLSVMLSYLFARRAMRPITNIIRSVKEINSFNLNNRLDEGDRKDEIAQLAITFNKLLSDLEIAFRNQEDFVTNASHELRTPLSVMISESDYMLSHNVDKEEYVKHIRETNADLKVINSLLNNLLELAQLSPAKTILFQKVRIDEVLFNSIYQVKLKYPGRKLVPKILFPENENDLNIKGSEGLLTIAFKNLLDNACKFSDDDVIIDFKITGQSIIITISDSGIGIPQEEIATIFRPFSRASNAKFIGGFGIGLTLVYKILELHKTSLNISSVFNQGTSIEIKFGKFTEK